MTVAQKILTRMILKVRLNFLDNTGPRKVSKATGSGLVLELYVDPRYVTWRLERQLTTDLTKPQLVMVN